MLIFSVYLMPVCIILPTIVIEPRGSKTSSFSVAFPFPLTTCLSVSTYPSSRFARKLLSSCEQQCSLSVSLLARVKYLFFVESVYSVKDGTYFFRNGFELRVILTLLITFRHSFLSCYTLSDLRLMLLFELFVLVCFGEFSLLRCCVLVMDG